MPAPWVPRCGADPTAPSRPPAGRRRTRQGPARGPDGRRHRAGFTLLEVLVALVVLAVALTALLEAQTLAVRLRSQAQELTLATFLLQDRMTQVLLGPLPEPGTQEGDFGPDYPGYRWEVTVSDTGFATTPRVREVRVRVLWGSGRRPEALELTGFVAERPR
ncbi:MAG TPA: type II secretion system minor pseudopilin GspI [Thermodesulfobacteriota bacterium]|nr:type II secretion system minor pseudopilin GspI [Thermodesulfobacteriota bacterium]